MKKIKTLLYIALFILIPSSLSAEVLTPLDQFTSTTTPTSSISQRTWGKPIKITGLSPLSNLCLNSNNIITTSGCSGSGIGSATSTNPFMATYFVATSTIATTTFSGPVNIGGNSSRKFPYLLIATTTTPKYGYLQQSVLDAGGEVNDYISLNVYNNSSGACASADFTANNDQSNITTDFADLGHTGSGWTGVGCSTPLTGVVANSTYIFDPNKNVSTLVNSGYINWFTGGYAASNEKMRLTNAGNLGIGTTTPANHLSVQGSGYISSNLFVGGTITSTSTTASIFPYASTTAISSSGSAYFATSGGNVTIGSSAGFGDTLNVQGRLGILQGQGILFRDSSNNDMADIIGTSVDSNNGYLPFRTRGGGVVTERMRIDQNGFVGIGTTSPQSKLDVSASSAGTTLTTDSTAAAGVTNTNTTVNNFSDYLFKMVNSVGTTLTGAKVSAIFTDHTSASEDVDVAWSSMVAGTLSEKMRLKGASLGIGTTSPARQLSLEGGAASTFIRLQRNNSTIGSGGLEFTGNDALIDSYIYYNGDVGQALTIGTGAGAASTRMTIVDGGNIGIGSTTPQGALDIGVGGGGGGVHTQLNGGNSDTVPALSFTSGGIGTWGSSTYGFGLFNSSVDGDLDLFRLVAGISIPALTISRSTGSFAIGSTTSLANLQVTNSSVNATTSIQFGKANQNKGTCATYYDTAGTPVYSYIPAGTTAWTNTSVQPSGCQN